MQQLVCHCLVCIIGRLRSESLNLSDKVSFPILLAFHSTLLFALTLLLATFQYIIVLEAPTSQRAGFTHIYGLISQHLVLLFVM